VARKSIITIVATIRKILRLPVELGPKKKNAMTLILVFILGGIGENIEDRQSAVVRAVSRLMQFVRHFKPLAFLRFGTLQKRETGRVFALHAGLFQIGESFRFVSYLVSHAS
jgi:hypothetical protein